MILKPKATWKKIKARWKTTLCTKHKYIKAIHIRNVLIYSFGLDGFKCVSHMTWWWCHRWYYIRLTTTYVLLFSRSRLLHKSSLFWSKNHSLKKTLNSALPDNVKGRPCPPPISPYYRRLRTYTLTLPPHYIPCSGDRSSYLQISFIVAMIAYRACS